MPIPSMTDWLTGRFFWRLDLYALFIIVFIGHLADIATTFTAIEYLGAHERNPVFARLLHGNWKFKWPVMIAAKLGLISKVHITDLKYNDYVSRKSLQWSAVVIWCVVAWNLLVITKKLARRK